MKGVEGIMKSALSTREGKRTAAVNERYRGNTIAYKVIGLHTVNTKRYDTYTDDTIPVVSVSLTVKRYFFRNLVTTLFC